MRMFKKIFGKINVPLIIFLVLVGGLLFVANMKNQPVKEAKEKVNNAVDNVSKSLNSAAKSNSSPIES
ncbi:hypothetical protein [Francisella sp. XLW-1]|uniref:hypothetical protein n=1 Tax=Francisella sp. XLW-1 TaxID=2610887 RepID=UPI00123DEC6B|nr:hypothetical protein [Francisella sp. XLW-1]